MTSLLSIRDLTIRFETKDGPVEAVRGIDLDINRGETLCLLGESGSGKSVTCHALLGLLPPNGRVTGGSALFDGQDLLRLGEGALMSIRGRRIAMVFQDPTGSLNPVHRVGQQLLESLAIHRGLRGSSALAEAVNLLKLVGIPDPQRRLEEYPHQLSGGMNQRVMIAIALVAEPELLIADEPTTALDVTIQAQILALLKRLQAERGMAMLFVTHDLGVVSEIADTVAVMRHGTLREAGPAQRVLNAPGDDYTRRLIDLMPRLDVAAPLYQPPGQAA